MKSEFVATAERMKSVSRPGFLAAYLFLLFRSDGVGRTKMTKRILVEMTRLAENFVSCERLELAFSNVLATTQLEKAMAAIKALEGWELSEKDRFQARTDILYVMNSLSDSKDRHTDDQARVNLLKLQSIINDLWKQAVEKPHQSQSTTK